jgi:pimeloyl-ACP methyl ester carboxylesterase
MSSSVCFARGTCEHRPRHSSGEFLSAISPQLSQSNFFCRRIKSSVWWAFSALCLAAALAAAGSPSVIAQIKSQVGAQDARALRPPAPLIVIGFMGGHVRAGNLVHREALLVRDLERRYPTAVRAMTFANSDEAAALHSVLSLLDTENSGWLSDGEKSAARIVIFGHSWGASEAVNLAQELDRRGVPVLLTIQVDSVRKHGEDDGSIPANVHEAVNFYQTDGVLHGRSSIQAVDPARTKILGNYESTYKVAPVSCAGFPWFARAFMKPHIEIENDVAVWDQIDALIVARSCAANPAAMARACGEAVAAPNP